MNKTWIGAIIAFFVVLFVYTKLTGPVPFSINSVNTTKTDLFSSSGEGKATAIPDQATVDAGVTQTAATVVDAQNKVNAKTQKIIIEIKKLGVLDKDIKTTNYSVTPNYGDNGGVPMMFPIRTGRNNITGYTVTQNLEINVKDLAKVNKAIDSATANGANMVGGTNFTFSDELQKKLENQARIQAVNNAKEKAQSLANASGIRLGKVVNVIESGNGFPQPLAMMKGAGGAADQSTPTNVTPGENNVTINVVIYYETY